MAGARLKSRNGRPTPRNWSRTKARKRMLVLYRWMRHYLRTIGEDAPMPRQTFRTYNAWIIAEEASWKRNHKYGW